MGKNSIYRYMYFSIVNDNSFPFLLVFNKCKMLAASQGYNSSVMITKCLWRYDVCRMVDSNLEIIYSTRIRLHCRTNHYPSNMGSKLELNTAPYTLSSELLQHLARLIPTLRCYVAIMTSPLLRPVIRITTYRFGGQSS